MFKQIVRLDLICQKRNKNQHFVYNKPATMKDKTTKTRNMSNAFLEKRKTLININGFETKEYKNSTTSCLQRPQSIF